MSQLVYLHSKVYDGIQIGIQIVILAPKSLYRFPNCKTCFGVTCNTSQSLGHPQLYIRLSARLLGIPHCASLRNLPVWGGSVLRGHLGGASLANRSRLGSTARAICTAAGPALLVDLHLRLRSRHREGV